MSGSRVISALLILAALVLVILAAMGEVALWWSVLCLVAEGIVRIVPLE